MATLFAAFNDKPSSRQSGQAGEASGKGHVSTSSRIASRTGGKLLHIDACQKLTRNECLGKDLADRDHFQESAARRQR
jgi:hypothetical protein